MNRSANTPTSIETAIINLSNNPRESERLLGLLTVMIRARIAQEESTRRSRIASAAYQARQKLKSKPPMPTGSHG